MNYRTITKHTADIVDYRLPRAQPFRFDFGMQVQVNSPWLDARTGENHVDVIEGEITRRRASVGYGGKTTHEYMVSGRWYYARYIRVI